MAPKRYPQIDDLPAAASSASSDDEIEEQEEDSSDQEQQQHEESKPQKTDSEQDEDESEESDDETEEEQEEDSSDEEQQQQPDQDEDEPEESNDEEEPVLHKHSVQKYPSPSQSEPSEGSGSDSDSDGTQNSPTAYAFTIKPIASKPMEISPKLKKPISKSIQLKQPSAKRPVETEQNGSGSMNKKSKVSNGDGPGKKSTLNLLWSEDDEIVILKGMIDYQTQKDADPYSDMAVFHEFVKDSLSVDVSKSQLAEKIRRLKKKYQNNAEKGENGEDHVFSKSHEHKTFELSKKIWGGRVKINGVDGSKVKSSKRKDKKDEKVVNNTVPKLMENTKKEGMEFWSMYPRLSESLESETSVYLSLPKDVKNFVKERISLLGREKVSQLEEKWKDIRVMECNLFAKRLELIHDQTQMVLHEMKPSKS